MHKLVLLFLLSNTAVYPGLVSAQDAYGGYRYPESSLEPLPMSGAQQQSRYLRWRPLEQDTGEASANTHGGESSPYPGAGDYTDQPPGVPAGTYRRIEERHTITPQLEGYRFRPIDPEEQVRNRSRNETQERENRERSFSRTWGSRIDEVYRGGEPSSDYIFRPDPRLDSSSQERPPRYSFPIGVETPIYRPQQ